MPTLITEPYRIAPMEKRLPEYPMKHAVPIAFGHGESPESFEFHSATATLANFGKGPLVITCEHVIQALQELKQTSAGKKNVQLFVSRASVDINRTIIAADAKLDIATFSLTTSEVDIISKSNRLYGTRCVERIYSGPIQKGDMIAFTGFPAQPEFRYRNEKDLFAFHALATSLATVEVANEGYLICQMDDLPSWIRPENDPKEFNDPRGMSGGPAFLVRKQGSSFFHYFIGILYEATFLAKDCLTLYIRRLTCLNEDGTLKEAYFENH